MKGLTYVAIIVLIHAAFLYLSGSGIRCYNCEMKKPFHTCEPVHSEAIIDCHSNMKVCATVDVVASDPDKDIIQFFARNETRRKLSFCAKDMACTGSEENYGLGAIGLFIDRKDCMTCSTDDCNQKNRGSFTFHTMHKYSLVFYSVLYGYLN